MNLFFWRKKQILELTNEEAEVLLRENAESRDHALPDAAVNDSFGNGSFFNNISRIQATTNQSGLGAIVERKVFEPRIGQSKNDQEAL